MAKEKQTDEAEGSGEARKLDVSLNATNTVWKIPGGLKGLNDVDYNGPRPTGRKPFRGGAYADER
jgi:hypothetical protein